MKEHQAKHALTVAIRTVLWGGSILVNGSLFAASDNTENLQQNSEQLPTITVTAANRGGSGNLNNSYK